MHRGLLYLVTHRTVASRSAPGRAIVRQARHIAANQCSRGLRSQAKRPSVANHAVRGLAIAVHHRLIVHSLGLAPRTVRSQSSRGLPSQLKQANRHYRLQPVRLCRR